VETGGVLELQLRKMMPLSVYGVRFFYFTLTDFFALFLGDGYIFKRHTIDLGSA
jgi:hypothetical protein